MPFGWIGNLLLISGAWQIGHKRRWGFLLTMAGGLCWICQGAIIGRSDLIFIDSVMELVTIRNWIKWGK